MTDPKIIDLLITAHRIAERVIYAESGGYEGDTNSERKSTMYLCEAWLKRFRDEFPVQS